MTRSEAGKLGGQKMAPKIREKALNLYYSNPNFCKECSQLIRVRDNERPSFAKKRIFCCSSCAAKYNLRNRVYKPRVTECKRCGKKIELKKGSTYKRNYCEKCLPVIQGEKSSERQGPTAKVRRKDIPELTKGELLSKAGNPYKFKLYVTWHAKKVFTETYKDLNICCLCSFEHIEVCHKKDVADFDDTDLIREINDPKNLVGLCPNHHWAFDNKRLNDDDLAEIEEAHRCKR